MLFLVDTSQSLVQRDPEAARGVTALQSAVRSLATLQSATAATDDPVSVYVEFAEFGSITQRTFAERTQWQLLNTDDALIEQLAAYAEKNTSEDTDYVAALEPWHNRADPARPPTEIGALQLLEEAPPGSCRLLVWFTDGQFDIDFQETPKTLHWANPPIEVASDDAEVGARRGRARQPLRGGRAS